MRTRWAVLGPGGISSYFARALPRSRFSVLHAVASSDARRAATFASTHGAAISGTYEQILDRTDVDAVYIGTVHTTHAALAESALAAGKAVLCEKPATPTLEATERLLAAAGSAELPFLEAFKYRFGPFCARLAALIAEGAIGEVRTLDASFGFAAGERAGRLFEPELAGGALLDVGGYAASFAVGVAAWSGLDLSPQVVPAQGRIGDTGVDEHASASVRFGGFEARIRTSIVEDLPRDAVLRGTAGRLVLPDAWGSRTESASAIILERAGRESIRIECEVTDPFAAEADAVSLALREVRAEIPEVPWSHTLATARILAQWRAAM